jgi:menaquinone-dependent protoporphyrinogen oxidase
MSDVPVLVTYASKYGATQGIAERIAAILRLGGHEVDLRPVEAVEDPSGYDGYVIGSSIYAFHWDRRAVRFVLRHREAMAGRPVWLFSSGPLGTETVDAEGRDVRGSAGPKELPELTDAVDPVEHHVFFGALHADALNLGLRTVRRLMPKGEELMPEGDFRDWQEIEAWARGIDGGLDHLGAAPAGVS